MLHPDERLWSVPTLKAHSDEHLAVQHVNLNVAFVKSERRRCATAVRVSDADLVHVDLPQAASDSGSIICTVYRCCKAMYGIRDGIRIFWMASGVPGAFDFGRSTLSIQ